MATVLRTGMTTEHLQMMPTSFSGTIHTVVFAGIGGNILPASTGARGVARFENHDQSDWLGMGTANYAMIVSARNALDNVALQMNGGYISGLAVKTAEISASGTICS